MNNKSNDPAKKPATSNQKHTPDPWLYTPGEWLKGHGLNGGDVKISDPIVHNRIKTICRLNGDTCEEDAARIVACVNACSIMKDPNAEINRLKAERDELLVALELSKKYMQKSGINYDNAEVWNAITKAINNTKGGGNG